MATDSEDQKQKQFKAIILIFVSISMALVLISRLAYLQISQHKNYTEKAQYSSSRISIITAPRGNIFDRNGKLLATTKQSISVIAYPDRFKSEEDKLKIYKILSEILNTDKEKLKEAFLKMPEKAPFPIRVATDVSIEESTLIVENQHILPGIDIQEEPIRYYPHGELAAHVIGYVGEIGDEELIRRPDRRLGDLVGKDGIEKLYDDILRGKDGKKIVLVDRYGKAIDTSYKYAIIDIKPVPGRNIYLTIDLNLQKALENALRESMASSTATTIDVKTGEVLALGNIPTFDPNIFTKPIPQDTWNRLIKEKAFLNKALLPYVPGSIWKPITLLAALDSMVVRPEEKFAVGGAIYLGSTRFGDWTSKSAIYSLQECLAWSRDTAFYQIAQRLKPEQIREWGVTLGAGRKTGIELIGEEEGIVPDSLWKEKNVGEKWYPGNTLHYSIGQSFLLVTPIQMARVYSAIANGEIVPKLQLIKKIDKISKPIQQPETYKVLPAALKVVKEGLEMCIESGTGQVVKFPTVRVAGKTGSAEVPGSSKTHGWFASYAPADNPQIAIVAFAEKAGHGGTVAAPIAKKIYEEYFGFNKKIEEQELIIPKNTEREINIIDFNLQSQMNNTETIIPQKKKRFKLFKRN